VPVGPGRPGRGRSARPGQARRRGPGRRRSRPAPRRPTRPPGAAGGRRPPAARGPRAPPARVREHRSVRARREVPSASKRWSAGSSSWSSTHPTNHGARGTSGRSGDPPPPPPLQVTRGRPGDGQPVHPTMPPEPRVLGVHHGQPHPPAHLPQRGTAVRMQRRHRPPPGIHHQRRLRHPIRRHQLQRPHRHAPGKGQAAPDHPRHHRTRQPRVEARERGTRAPVGVVAGRHMAR
jgi:hypothetical protein